MATLYATDVFSRSAAIDYGPDFDIIHDGNHENAIGPPSGDFFRVDFQAYSGTYAFQYHTLQIYVSFGMPIMGSLLRIGTYDRSDFTSYDECAGGRFRNYVYGSNDPDAWGDATHTSWEIIDNSLYDWDWGATAAVWTWGSLIINLIRPYTYFLLTRGVAVCYDNLGDYFECQAIRITGDNIVTPYEVNPPVGGGDAEGIPSGALDVDGNGDILYLGLYTGVGNPVFITVPLPLDSAASTGTGRYVPTSGDAINVKAHGEVGNYVVVSGYFGLDVQTHQSTDGGVTLTQIDPGNWGDNRAQPIAINPNDENDILVALHILDDLMSYDGSGTSWTTLDAALAFDVGALAMYDLNPDEIFIGRDAAGADVILYSPSSGADWEDITLLMAAGAIANIEVV